MFFIVSLARTPDAARRNKAPGIAEFAEPYIDTWGRGSFVKSIIRTGEARLLE